jgi:phosphoacetylglucosamine mutase
VEGGEGRVFLSLGVSVCLNVVLIESLDLDIVKQFISKKFSFIFFSKLTRPSSEPLCKAVLDGVASAGGDSKSFGLVSTPQLHYLVVCHNTNGAYGQASEEGYFNKLSKAFKKFRGDVNHLCSLK